jgi:DNA topoisomerase-6 subunit A
MAKKPAKSEARQAVLTAKDKRTMSSLRQVAEEVVTLAERGRGPHLDVPSRSLSNVKFNQSKKIIEMGSLISRRPKPTCRRCWSAAASNS